MKIENATSKFPKPKSKFQLTMTQPTYRPAATHSLYPDPYTLNYAFFSKERDVETGYSYFGARYYSSDLSIWLSVDPMSDKYPSMSPYVYCANNPVKLVDPNGEEIVIIGKDGSATTYTQGMEYSGNDRFTKKTIRALNKLYDGESKTGSSMVDQLVKSNNKFKIQKQDTKKKTNSDFTPDNYMGAQIGVKHYAEKMKELGINYEGNIGAGGTINWNSSSCRVMTSKGLRNNPFFGLVHELSHALDADNGIMDYTEVAGMEINEWQACANTNIIRKEFGKPLQTYYGGKINQFLQFSGGVKIVNKGVIMTVKLPQ